MRNTFILVILLSLVSCVSKEESKSCSINDQSVDCSALKSGNVSIGGEDEIAISVFESKFDVLENLNIYATEMKNSKHYECSSKLNAGDSFFYSASENTLLIGTSRNQSKFTRIAGMGKTIEGVWQEIEHDQEGSVTTTINFSKESMKFKMTCFFKK